MWTEVESGMTDVLGAPSIRASLTDEIHNISDDLAKPFCCVDNAFTYKVSWEQAPIPLEVVKCHGNLRRHEAATGSGCGADANTMEFWHSTSSRSPLSAKFSGEVSREGRFCIRLSFPTVCLQLVSKVRIDWLHVSCGSTPLTLGVPE